MTGKYRTMSDVYSLVEPQQPLNPPYEAGEPVQIRTNVDRVAAHGWIINVFEREDKNSAIAELTAEGASLLNYYARGREEGWLGQELKHGGGHFVDLATSAHKHDDPEIVKFDGDVVVLRMPDGTTRTYAAETANA